MALSKQQIQYIVLGVIVGAGALYVAVAFGLAPLMESFSGTGEETENLQEKIEKAQVYIRGREKFADEYEIAVARINQAATNIPMPVYNNYQMNLKKNLEDLAEDIDIHQLEIFNGSQQEFPRGKSVFKQYKMTLSIKAGFFALLDYVRRVEESNPYVIVESLSISAQSATPETHNASLTLSWLIWQNPDNLPDVVKNHAAASSAQKGLQ